MHWSVSIITVFLLGFGPCSDDSDPRAECVRLQDEGDYTRQSNTACGCWEVECSENAVCFQHDCCNPALNKSNPDACDCRTEGCCPGC